MNAGATILLADDDASICAVIEQALKRRGLKALVTDDPRQLIDWARDGRGQAAITDVLMPGGNGLDTLPKLRQMRPDLPVIVISAQNTLMTAVKANELGAYDYFSKPFDLNALVQSIEQSIMQADRPANDMEIPPELPIVGRSPAMQEIYRTIARMTNAELTVMIEGESGTGKELIARAIHSLGRRKNKPFVALNMAAIPPELVESELFGHEKGAVAGAAPRKSGKFAQAQGGTLFLDEIGDMPLDAQAKLLRVLQEGEFTAVGGHLPLKTDARIICATHRDLRALVKKGEFREDLFYRLHVVPVRVPTLSERREDIPELVRLFLRKAAERGLPRKEMSDDAVERLTRHEWPGNVRALENLVYRLAALQAEPVIGLAAVEQELSAPRAKNEAAEISLEESVRRSGLEYLRNTPNGQGLYAAVSDRVERALIELALQESNHNQLRAARLLGINRNTLRKKLAELRIPLHATPAENP